MLTADIAFRVNAHGDYGVADALGLVSGLCLPHRSHGSISAELKERA